MPCGSSEEGQIMGLGTCVCVWGPDFRGASEGRCARWEGLKALQGGSEDAGLGRAAQGEEPA